MLLATANLREEQLSHLEAHTLPRDGAGVLGRREGGRGPGAV